MERGGIVLVDFEVVVVSLLLFKEVVELKKQVESVELKNQWFKEVFQIKIQEFCKVCYMFIGYQIDIIMENQYWLILLYVEYLGDCFIFKVISFFGF